MPHLKKTYYEENGMKLGLVYIKDAVAEFADMKGNFEQMQLTP